MNPTAMNDGLTLYVIERDGDWDEFDAFVIYAKNPDDARYLAKQRAYQSGYRPAKAVSDAIEEDPQKWDEANVMKVEMERGIILGSFRSVLT